MNYRMLGYVLGRIFMVEAALLLPPSIVAVIYGEWSCLFAFVVTAAPPTRRSMRARVL